MFGCFITTRLLTTLFAIVSCLTVHQVRGFGIATPTTIGVSNRLRARKQGVLFARGGKSGTKKKKAKDGTISVNRLAYRNYEVLEKMTAGISLLGTEVKSIRDGKMNLRDGFVKPTKEGQCSLHNVHIGQHTGVGGYFHHDERRIRPLLLNKNEARKLAQKVDQKGMTVVPLKAFFNERNLVKIEIGLCRGKNVRDKRDTIKEREAKRETNRIVKNFRV